MTRKCDVWGVLFTVVVVVVVVVVVWDTVECVCMYTPHSAHVQASHWFYPCRPGNVGLRTPQINLPRSWDEQDCPPNHGDYIASSCNQHLKHQCTQNNATSSTHVDEHAWKVPRRCAGVFLLSRIRFLPGTKSTTKWNIPRNGNEELV